MKANPSPPGLELQDRAKSKRLDIAQFVSNVALEA